MATVTQERTAGWAFGFNWADPLNITAEDGNTADLDGYYSKMEIFATDFGFDIPFGAKIEKVEVYMKYTESGFNLSPRIIIFGKMRTESASLEQNEEWFGGSFDVDGDSDAWFDAETTEESFNAGIINNRNFGIGLDPSDTQEEASISIDVIKMRITYDDSPSFVEISSLSELDAIRNDTDANYKLVGDIDASGTKTDKANDTGGWQTSTSYSEDDAVSHNLYREYDTSDDIGDGYQYTTEYSIDSVKYIIDNDGNQVSYDQIDDYIIEITEDTDTSSLRYYYYTNDDTFYYYCIDSHTSSSDDEPLIADIENIQYDGPWSIYPSLDTNIGFKPIGEFSGALDGNGYKIDGLVINRFFEEVALFNEFNGELKDITLESFDISGRTLYTIARTFESAIFCNFLYGKIDNCNIVSSSVFGTRNVALLSSDITGDGCFVSNSSVDGVIDLNKDVLHIGGFFAETSGSIHIYDSTANVEALSNSFDKGGGIVGRLRVIGDVISDILQCSTSGKLIGKEAVGGLVGEYYGANYSQTYIENSFSRMDLKAYDSDEGSCAGLIGYLDSVSSESYIDIYTSYYAGEVSAGDSSGGLVVVGDNNGTLTFFDNFYDEDVSGQSSTTAGTPKTTSEMQDIDTYTDTATSGLDEPWDMVLESNHDGDKDTALWFIDDGNEYPQLWFGEMTFDINDKVLISLKGTKKPNLSVEQGSGEINLNWNY